MAKIYQLRRQELIDLLEAKIRLEAIHKASASMYANYDNLNPKAINKEINKRLSHFQYIEED